MRVRLTQDCAKPRPRFLSVSGILYWNTGQAHLDETIVAGFEDIDRLLDLVWEMDLDVNMYLAGVIDQAQLVPRILQACRRIRAVAPDVPTDRSIDAIEHDAREIDHPFVHARAGTRKAVFAASADSELMKDIFNLRAQLSNSRILAH